VRVTVVAEQLALPVPGGIGVWVREVTRRLARGPHELHLLGSRSLAPSRLVGPACTLERVWLPHQLAQRCWDIGAWRAPRRGWVAWWPSFAGPRLASSASVVTVHDVIYLSHPEYFTPHGVRWHRRRLEEAIARAGRLLAVDESVAEELVALGADPARVVVVPPGADHLPPADREAARAVLERAGVARPYLLAIGTLEPRKNLPRLLEAYRRYRARAFDPVDLVIVGPSGWGPELPAQPGVHLLGGLAEPILAGVLALARAVAYVSLAEGFGLPVVEAFAAAVPVLVSTRVPASRLGGLAVDPYDVVAIAEGIATVVEDEATRSQLVTQGLLAIEGVTWDRSSALVARALEEVADG